MTGASAKVYFPVRRGRNSRGLSRKAIMTEVDASLRRLGADSVATRASGRSRGVRWA